MAPTLRLLGAAAAAAALAAATGPATPGLVDVSSGARALVVGAGSAGVDGTYSCAEFICLQEGPRGRGAHEIRWYYEASAAAAASRAPEAEPLWPSGWYLERGEDRAGIYYMDSGNTTHLPLGAWRVWSGEMSAPGAEPPPVVTLVDSTAFQAQGGAATGAGEQHATNRRFFSPVVLSSAVFSFVTLVCLTMLMRRQSPHFSRREVGHLIQDDAKEYDETEPE